MASAVNVESAATDEEKEESALDIIRCVTLCTPIKHVAEMYTTSSILVHERAPYSSSSSYISIPFHSSAAAGSAFIEKWDGIYIGKVAYSPFQSAHLNDVYTCVSISISFFPATATQKKNI